MEKLISPLLLNGWATMVQNKMNIVGEFDDFVGPPLYVNLVLR